jgi:hypothetical protein
MGERLVRYYQFVSEKGGLQLKIKLAAMTKVPSTQAAIEPDSQANVELFRRAVEQLVGPPAPKY